MDWVKDVFDYHPDGFLIWKISPSSKIKVGDKAGATDPRGYTRIGYRGSLYYLHRLIYFIHHGEYPDLVDHKDRDKTNNQIDNLRAQTKGNNTVNSDSVWGDVPRRGVYFNTRKKKYHAAYRGKHIGYFDDLEEAALAYQAARTEEGFYIG